MKSPRSFFLILTLLVLGGCSLSHRSREESVASTAPQTQKGESSFAYGRDSTKPQESTTAQVSLKQADQSQLVAEAMDRKIIRNAELTLEVAAPEDAQRKISSIAESLGGFVVTSESKQRQTGDSGKQELEVNLVIRVPAAQFGPALDQIHTAGSRVIQ